MENKEAAKNKQSMVSEEEKAEVAKMIQQIKESTIMDEIVADASRELKIAAAAKVLYLNLLKAGKIQLPAGTFGQIPKLIMKSAPTVAKLAIREDRTAEEDAKIEYRLEKQYGGDMGRLHNDTMNHFSRSLGVNFPRYTDNFVKIGRDTTKVFAEQMFELWTPDQLEILGCGLEAKTAHLEDEFLEELAIRAYKQHMANSARYGE
ncbi:hypothetical protein PVAG01_09792 [Phlyctema vagabunda]|uniref:Uncharacterized protein n=1 Tax=Phlyctema vagabunda TaxID=108571 RepID=A0ABR4P499_9HELO